MPISSSRLSTIVDFLRTRPGHENVRGVIRELCVVGLDLPDQAANFEVPVPEVRGRIDAVFGSTIFEFKRDLRREQRDAEDGLLRYLADRERSTGRRYLGIATDGANFVAYQTSQGRLERLDEFSPSQSDPRALLRWLDTATTAREELFPDAVTVRSEFGRDSLVFRRALEDLRLLWRDARAVPEALLKYDLWSRHLEFVYGTLIEPDELFLQHTYLTIVAKTMAIRVLVKGRIQPGELLAGAPFTQSGLNGAIEADFFDWILLVPGGDALVDRIALQVGRFRLSEIEADVLKAIYESLIDPRQRHYLGEYYTPDWLAEWVYSRAVPDPLDTKVLDPSCGSGTFLFTAVRHFLDAAEKGGVPLQEALSRCVDQVSGLDVHPVAVLFARVTYLLAIGADRLRRKEGPLSIPVYLGDALQWDVRELLSEEEVEIAVPGEPPLRFPGSVAGDPALLDNVLRTMREFADQAASIRSFQSWLNAKTTLPDTDKDILIESFEHMSALHAAGRNHIWTFVVRNLTRPLWLSLRKGRPDVLLGNPPWLRYNAMSPDLQLRFREASKARGLWEGGKLAPHHDLSAYFFARSVERYLGRTGHIAFVMPFATLTRGQYAGFRTGRFSDRRGNTAAIVRFEEIWTFDSDVRPLFEVPSCVIFGRKSATSGKLPATVTAYKGALPRRDATPSEALANLVKAEQPWPTTVKFNNTSIYRDRFKQGATLVPRRLTIVQSVAVGKFGEDPSAPVVESRVGSQDKAPWKFLSPYRGQVERQFLRPVLLGESIGQFRVLEPTLGVVPWYARQKVLLDADAALDQGYPHLATWMRKVEQAWTKHSSGSMTLIERWDYHKELTRQFPVSPHRVVYSKAGIFPAACLVTDPEILIDHKLYWGSFETIDECRFLVATLNSEAVRSRVEGMQSQGQWGARDFDKVMFNLPIPRFDQSDRQHQDLVSLGERAESIAGYVEIPDNVGFQRARKLIRDALLLSNVSSRIDQIVTQIIG
ncbi:hypothetical protein FJW07_30320 [Mesorhizobium sp. B3-1-9]|uniref:N-6 DNA methylase n=1 Tax=Mesorhizobium sp. B3-1-9 TaxID=2589892 RepID=UPI0011287AA8|nr:N-6 DNA methylase [Mesorhizobium sp. B3-1-9]TPI29237.1 hypothetical protein FJW07_30320 [Mesorhizobium sp. B3-1-9]